MFFRCFQVSSLDINIINMFQHGFLVFHGFSPFFVGFPWFFHGFCPYQNGVPNDGHGPRPPHRPRRLPQRAGRQRAAGGDRGDRGGRGHRRRGGQRT